jgi:DNA-binding transcriptional MocR family regulator
MALDAYDSTDEGRLFMGRGPTSEPLFPSLRPGFLIVPPDLQDGLVAARRVEATPLGAYFAGRGRVDRTPNALVQGFAAVRPGAAPRGMERLARRRSRG